MSVGGSPWRLHRVGFIGPPRVNVRRVGDHRQEDPQDSGIPCRTPASRAGLRHPYHCRQRHERHDLQAAQTPAADRQRSGRRPPSAEIAGNGPLYDVALRVEPAQKPEGLKKLGFWKPLWQHGLRLAEAHSNQAGLQRASCKLLPVNELAHRSPKGPLKPSLALSIRMCNFNPLNSSHTVVMWDPWAERAFGLQ
jgi:hypothetical protein